MYGRKKGFKLMSIKRFVSKNTPQLSIYHISEKLHPK
jgi:hypothetical protein